MKLMRFALPLALFSGALHAQVIDYPLPQTQCSVQYNRSYYGTFVCPQYSGAAIPVTINNVAYDLTFSLYVDATQNPQQIVPSRSVVSFCQHGVTPTVCSIGSPSGTFTPFPVGQYWGTASAAFIADGAAGKFDGSPGSTLIFFKPGRGASYLRSDSVLRLSEGSVVADGTCPLKQCCPNGLPQCKPVEIATAPFCQNQCSTDPVTHNTRCYWVCTYARNKDFLAKLR